MDHIKIIGFSCGGPLDTVEGVRRTAHRARGESARSAARPLASRDLEHATAGAVMLNHQAVALAAENRLDEATRLLDVAVGLAPGMAMTHQNLGAVALLRDLPAEAAAHFEAAARLDPRSSKARFNLANAYRRLGRVPEAIAQLRQVLSLEPSHHSAGHILAACTGESPDAPPPRFVEALFDQFASTFEQKVVGDLGYQTPTKLRALLGEAFGDRDPLRFASALDLGCGTGLSGRAFADACGAMTGVDLSTQMLARAGSTGLYERLVHAELREHLRSTEARFDLFFAADSLNYLGDLRPVMQGVARCARPAACFVFSTEAGAGDGYRLSDTGRYTHARAYVERVAADAGMRVVLCRPDRLRIELGAPVLGDLFALAVDRAPGRAARAP